MSPKLRHNTYLFDESRQRWIIRYYDAHGKRRYHTMPEGSDEASTVEKANELERKASAGVLTADRGAPALKDVCEDYLSTVKPDIRDSTFTMYRGYVDNHISKMGAIPITRVSYDTLEEFKRERLEAGTTPVTLRKILGCLKRILDHAVRRKFIEHILGSDAGKNEEKQPDLREEEKKLPPELLQQLDEDTGHHNEPAARLISNFAAIAAGYPVYSPH